MKFSQTASFVALLVSGAFSASLAQPPSVARVRHAPEVRGTIEGSVHQMLAESMTLQSGATIAGDLFVAGLPIVRLSSSSIYGGTIDGTGAAIPSNYSITLGSGARLGAVVRRTDAVALPTLAFPPQPVATRSFTVRRATDAIGNFATLRNLTLQGAVGQIAVPPGTYGSFTTESGDDDDDDDDEDENGGGSSSLNGFTLGVAGAIEPSIYNFQRLSLSGRATLRVVGPVIVTVGQGLTVGGTIGASASPAWLRLQLAAGGLSLASGAVVYADLRAPEGRLSIERNARFTGSVAVDDLTVSSGAVLRVVSVTPNLPPVVALTAPINGTTLDAPATFTLAATASDAGGSVVMVEFYQGPTKLAEDTTAPYTFAHTLTTPGSYTFVARATDNLGASADSAGVTITINQLPFLATFEMVDGYQAGPLHGQRGWTATGSAIVGSALRNRGEHGVAVAPATPPALLVRAFVNTDPSVTFVDLFALPASAPTTAAGVFLETEISRVSLTGSAPAGLLLAFNGDGAGGGVWFPTGAAPPLEATGRTTAWLRLTTRTDYAARKWDLYYNGRMVAADLGFLNHAAVAFTSLGLGGHATFATGFDDVLIAFDNPLFADADHDGLDDAWETAHGLNPAANDRNSDGDGDGLTNIREYILGSHPNLADTDGDGLPDGWEVAHGMNPLLNADASLDSDGDGVTNLQEFLLGRNPTKGVLPDAAGIVNVRLFAPTR